MYVDQKEYHDECSNQSLCNHEKWPELQIHPLFCKRHIKQKAV